MSEPQLIATDITGRFKELTRQRDEALNRSVALAGAFAHLLSENEQLRKLLAEKEVAPSPVTS